MEDDNLNEKINKITLCDDAMWCIAKSIIDILYIYNIKTTKITTNKIALNGVIFTRDEFKKKILFKFPIFNYSFKINIFDEIYDKIYQFSQIDITLQNKTNKRNERLRNEKKNISW